MIKIKQGLFETKYSLFLFVVLSTIVFSFIAYSYGIFNYSPSHDSLTTFFTSDYEMLLKLKVGRIFVPLYRLFTRFTFNGITLPLLCWFFGTCWLVFSNYFVCKIFDIKASLLSFLLIGLLTVNNTLISLYATYMHEFEYSTLALLLSTLSLYFVLKEKKRYCILSVLFLVLSMGMYAAYFSVFVTLGLLYLIYILIQNAEWIKIRNILIKSCIVVFASAIVFYLSVKVVNSIFSVDSFNFQNYNSIGNISAIFDGSFLNKIYSTYYEFIYRLLSPETRSINPIPYITNLVLIAFSIILFIIYLFNKTSTILKKICVLICICLLPFTMNLMHFLSNGESHILMLYAIWLVYLLEYILIINIDIKSNKIRKISYYFGCGLFAVLLLNSVLFSNNILYKKKIQFDYTKDYLNRVIYRLEETEGYEEGITSVYIDAEGLNNTFGQMKGFEETYLFDYQQSSVTYGKAYKQYFDYFLNVPVKMIYYPELNENQIKNYNEMKAFPAKDCIRIVDGLAIVKLE